MKITKTKLKQLIKEELSAILEAGPHPAIDREDAIRVACNTYNKSKKLKGAPAYKDIERDPELKQLAEKIKDEERKVKGWHSKSSELNTGEEIKERCQWASTYLRRARVDMMEGEMTMGDKKFHNSPDFKPDQLTAHQQGRKDAQAGKPANPPKDPMRARDYMVGYDSAKDD